MIQFITIKSEFSSAHFYKSESYTDAENKKTFGRCFTQFGHGHNYKVQVAIRHNGKDLSEIHSEASKILNSITVKLDHEHLNFIIPEFKKTVPTTENILLYIESKLQKTKMAKSLVSIKLFEMENLWSEKYYVTT